jgi:hypothetical protein
MKYSISRAIFMLLLLLPFTACESLRENQREEIIKISCDAGIVPPPDIMPPPLVLSSFTGVNAGRVSGNMVGLLSQAAADPNLLVSEISSGRQTAGAFGYDPSDGIRIIIEKVFVLPQIVSPGDYLDMNIRYALLSPVHDNWTEIKETREMYFDGDLVGKPEAHVALVDGAYTTTVRLRLPGNTPPGEYRLVATVQTNYAIDTKDLLFYVEMRQ